ncbi:MAG: hypothetical protein RIK00_05665, partial [Algiphilus sp.]
RGRLIPHPPILVPRARARAWPPRSRPPASIGWAAFIGAVLALLALLMAWETLLISGDRPGWGLLAGCFAVIWLIALVPAVIAWSLAGRPR